MSVRRPIPMWEFTAWLVVMVAAVAFAISDLMVWSGRDLVAAVAMVVVTVWLVRR